MTPDLALASAEYKSLRAVAEGSCLRLKWLKKGTNLAIPMAVSKLVVKGSTDDTRGDYE